VEKRKLLCGPKDDGDGCEKADGSIWPPTILFTANFVAGMGGSLYYTLGVSYMDDNIQKAKTPALVSEYRHYNVTLSWLSTCLWNSPKSHYCSCLQLLQHAVYQTHTLTHYFL
jgi:hypothetical protein